MWDVKSPLNSLSRLTPFLTLAATLPTLQAGTGLIPPAAPSAGSPPSLVLDLSTQYEFSDPSPAGPGGDVFDSRVSLPLYVPLSKNWRIIGVVRGGFTDYETDPFGGEGLQTWNVGALLTLDGQLSEAWSGTFGLLGSASWEDGASFSDSLNGGGLVMASYRFSPTFKAGLGGLYLTRLNEDALVVPALGLDWQVTEQFDINLYGLDLRAEYDITEVWSIFLRGEFNPSGALLRSRANIEADSFDDQGFRAAGGVKWTPCPSFSLSMEGGVAFHEYTLRNDNEKILAKDRMDPSPFVGVSARLSF